VGLKTVHFFNYGGGDGVFSRKVGFEKSSLVEGDHAVCCMGLSINMRRERTLLTRFGKRRTSNVSLPIGAIKIAISLS
jgi:hypothetical protein